MIQSIGVELSTLTRTITQNEERLTSLRRSAEAPDATEGDKKAYAEALEAQNKLIGQQRNLNSLLRIANKTRDTGVRLIEDDYDLIQKRNKSEQAIIQHRIDLINKEIELRGLQRENQTKDPKAPPQTIGERRVQSQGDLAQRNKQLLENLNLQRKITQQTITAIQKDMATGVIRKEEGEAGIS